MNQLGVSLADYAGGPNSNQGGAFDFASTSPEALAQLSKALGAGSITGRDTANSSSASGSPLKVESLERNLKTLTFSESDITFWRKIPKLAAYNTVEEYNQLTSYGADRGGFYNEGELPDTEDSVYVRRAQLVKFLGVTKEVTHPMTLVNTNVGPIIQREITNGTMWILRKVNRALTFGDEKMVPQEFNGLYAQHRDNDVFSTEQQYLNSEVVIDLKGAPLSEAAIELGAEGIIENNGFGDLLMAPPRVLSDFVKNFYGNKFVNMPGGNVDSTIGHRTRKFASQFGDIDLVYDKFMNPSAPRLTTEGAQSAKCPNVPTSVTGAAVTDANNKFDVSSTGAGDYFYGVAAGNRFGESAVAAVGSALITVAGTQGVDLTFTDGGGTYPATYFTIYRSKKNPGTSFATTKLYPLFKVSVVQKSAGYNGASAGLVRDLNLFRPDTYQSLLIQHSEEVYAFKQLAPLMKMDLAILGPSQRFMVLLYGTIMLYAPKKMIRYINIGAATNSNLNTIL